MQKIIPLAASGLLAALASLGVETTPIFSDAAIESKSPALHLAAAGVQEIKIDSFKFGPATLTVPVGTKVVWTNDDPDPHTVTSATDPKLLKSPALDTGESFSFTFDKPGTYRYFCSIHPHMLGVVVVE